MSFIKSSKLRVLKILELLEPLYARHPIEVHYQTPFQLVVAVILSAQCTDKRVNIVTSKFFDTLRLPEDYLKISQDDLERLIKPTGFFRNKAKNIRAAAAIFLQDYDGKIPNSLHELVKIPGFGRKTANVVLAELYGIQEGIVVDTHVLRLSKRLGLSRSETAVAVERDLMRLTPREGWGKISHFLILHGRRVCFARNPSCGTCILRHLCPAFKTPEVRKTKRK